LIQNYDSDKILRWRCLNLLERNDSGMKKRASKVKKAESESTT
jgi:hypothetical protein